MKKEQNQDGGYFPGEESMTTDDLIFIIGEKEVDLFRKRKAIQKQITALQRTMQERKEQQKSVEDVLSVKEQNKKLERELSITIESVSSLQNELKKQEISFNTLKKEYEERIQALKKEHESVLKKVHLKLEKQREENERLREASITAL